MGNFFSLWKAFAGGKKEVRLLMLGFDAAGKTTILYKMKLNEVVNTIPTVGFNVETFQYKNIEFNCWDIGGQSKLRQMWSYYFDNVDALVYVVDSADHERIDENAEQLHSLLSDEQLKHAKLLVYANKQDLPNAMNVPTICEKLKLTKLQGRTWFVQEAQATNGAGLIEGMEWLNKQLA